MLDTDMLVSIGNDEEEENGYMEEPEDTGEEEHVVETEPELIVPERNSRIKTFLEKRKERKAAKRKKTASEKISTVMIFIAMIMFAAAWLGRFL